MQECSELYKIIIIFGGSMAQWVAHMTRNVEVMGSSPINGPRCFLEQETLPVLLSTGWLQEPRDFTIKLN